MFSAKDIQKRTNSVIQKQKRERDAEKKNQIEKLHKISGARFEQCMKKIGDSADKGKSETTCELLSDAYRKRLTDLGFEIGFYARNWYNDRINRFSHPVGDVWYDAKSNKFKILQNSTLIDGESLIVSW